MVVGTRKFLALLVIMSVTTVSISQARPPRGQHGFEALSVPLRNTREQFDVKVAKPGWKALAGFLLMFSPSLSFSFQHQRRIGTSQYHRELGAPSYRLAVGNVLMQAALEDGIEDKKVEEESSAQGGLKMREWSDIATGVNKAEYQAFCWGLPGAIPPLGNFDPLGIASGTSESSIKYFREAELTHGRVGMLAAAGFLVQEAFHPLFPDINGPAIKHMTQLPQWTWLVMSLGVGLCEASRIQTGWANPFQENVRSWSLKKDYIPGQWFDPLSMRYFLTPDEFRDMQEKELSHGRLAMIAAAGLVAQEAVTGTPWREQFGELLNR